MANSGPQVLNFPLWRGQDTSFVARRKDKNSGHYVNFAEDTIAKLIFTSGTTTVEVEGEIKGNAVFFIVRSDEVESIRNNASWRIQFTIDGRNESPVIGKVVRKDA